MSKNEVKSDSKFHLSLWMPKGYDPVIHICMIILMIYGIMMVGSASMGLSVGNNVQLFISIAKQVVYLLIGYFAMTFLAHTFRMSFLKGQKFPSLIFITIGLLFACLLFPEVNGAKAWLRIVIAGVEISFQPSEIAKISAFLIIAAYLGDVKDRSMKFWSMFGRPLILILGTVGVITLFQRDLGSAIVLLMIAVICSLIPNHPNLRKYQIGMKILIVLGIAGAVYLISPLGEDLIAHLPLAEYQKNRFFSAFNPFYDEYGSGYQLINGLVAFATGGWFGTGFGSSVRKYTSFPEANTDYILAILVEELGFVGFMVLLTLYGLIIFRLLIHAKQMKSEKGKIILVGTAMYLLIHAFFNIGGVTGLIPLTGVPLLMISAGGSSAMSFMAAVGISQAVISMNQRGILK